MFVYKTACSHRGSGWRKDSEVGGGGRGREMMHPFVIGTILAQPGEPGFPWQWDAFGGGPGKNGGNASASMYPVSDGTPHPKQKVCCAARPRPPGALRLGAPSLARAVARAHTPSRAGLLSRAPPDAAPECGCVRACGGQAGHYYEPWAPTYNTSGRMNGDSGMLPSQNDWEDVWRVTSGNGFGGPGDDLNINPLAHY